jgi:hypothetical protein
MQVEVLQDALDAGARCGPAAAAAVALAWDRPCVVVDGHAPFGILDANDAWLTVCGFEREEVVGKTLKILQGPATQKAGLDRLIEAVQSGASQFEEVLTNYTALGTPFQNELTVNAVGHKGGRFFVCHSTITLNLKRCVPEPVPMLADRLATARGIGRASCRRVGLCDVLRQGHVNRFGCLLSFTTLRRFQVVSRACRAWAKQVLLTLPRPLAIAVSDGTGEAAGVRQFCPTTLTWERSFGAIPHEMPECVSATMLSDGRVLVLTGDNAKEQPFDDFAVVTMRGRDGGWTAMPQIDYEVGCSGMCVALLNDSVLAMGGCKYDAATDKEVAMTKVQLLNMTEPESEWECVAPMLEGRGCAAGALMVDGRVIVCGGIGDGDNVLPTAEVYDPYVNAWTKLPDMAAGHIYHSVCVSATGIVVVGAGYALAGCPNCPIARVETYDRLSNTWSSLPDPCGTYVRGGLCAFGNDIIIAGGLDTYENEQDDGHLTEIFDADAAKWLSLPMKLPRRERKPLIPVSQGFAMLCERLHARE